MIIGYTTGVYDLFHIGHLNLLRNAKSMCDKLIVGVLSDEFVAGYKRTPLMSENDRLEIIRSIKYVDVAIPQRSIDKLEAWQKLKYNVLFVGDDWHNKPKWNETEEKLKEFDVKVIYFPYTQTVSSTKIIEALAK